MSLYTRKKEADEKNEPGKHPPDQSETMSGTDRTSNNEMIEENREIESQKTSDDKIRPKPWSAGVCKLKLVPPNRNCKSRISQMKELKMTYNEVQYRSPYVNITWEKGGASLPALMDSGADWSLISSENVTHTEREELGTSLFEGQSVTGQSLDIIGEVWRDMDIDELRIAKQRFVVVNGLLVDIILGADFWGRVSPLKIDLNSQLMWIMDHEVKLHYGQQSGEEGEKLKVQLVRDVELPPMTETLVECGARRMKENATYLYIPENDEDVQWGSPYSLIKADPNGNFCVRASNVSGKGVVIKGGTTMGQLESGVGVVHCVADSERGDMYSEETSWLKSASNITLGNSLSPKQKREVLEVVKR